uniref:Actin-binding LIM protein 1 n=1 Tax=Panagrellus redivivus TaxID=6233 RepID=A0A7E4VR20_PANRE
MGGTKCQICKRSCKGSYLRDGEKHFHIDCFKCTECKAPLSETGYYVRSDGTYVCPTHYKAISSPLVVRTEQPAATQQGQLPSPPLGSPSACAECGEQLSTGQVLLALNKSWHVWCFKCSECAAVLQGEYMARDGKPFCCRDYNIKFGVKCYECGRFIGGKVLEAGGYKFHPTCAQCSRCGKSFIDGEEMYMQGNEIWHPMCEYQRTTENLVSSASKTGSLRSRNEQKYPREMGQHLTYMYLLPGTEQTNLKHATTPHAPQVQHFHTPQAPIRIRKSRLATLKTGMQRLTEDLEKNEPRPKSPHMDNEEPIELAHYPSAHVPDPRDVPAIEREDFPAPPYPYAVEELKRRLSTSSIENDSEDDDDYGDHNKVDEEKIKKNVEHLGKYDKDSSIAHVIKQNIEESHKKQRLPLHWDPRNASRTPSAKKMPHLKFRYDTPINASPSRHLNRPKPWVFWQDQQTIDRAATTVLPCFHLPPSRTGTARAATLPDGYYYGQSVDNLDTTISSHFSDHSLNTLPQQDRVGGDMRTNLRTSLPDMSKPARIYKLEELQTTNDKLPEDVDRLHLERHLDRKEFEDLFGMTPIEFYKQPEWKRINLKRKNKLF